MRILFGLCRANCVATSVAERCYAPAVTPCWQVKSLRNKADHFEKLAAENRNFSWHAVLSEPRPEDHWEGPQGVFHNRLYDNYLKEHLGPEECKYYLCGPPMLWLATREMLENLGEERDQIRSDDFGI